MTAQFHTSKGAKVYVKYCRPYKDSDDEPPIEEVWSLGERPKKRLADMTTLFVYDFIDGVAINERPWDGVE